MPPQYSPYYIGAAILSKVYDLGVLDFDMFELYQEMEDTPFSYYVLALDWLFLLGVLDSKGDMICTFKT